jgi:hypothetical protein
VDVSEDQQPQRAPDATAEVSISWSDEDDEYVATTPLYPSLSWLDPDPAAATDGLVELVRSCVSDASR